MMKPAMKSKTLWFNALTAASVLLAAPELQAMLGDHALQYAVLAQACINVLLRFLTTQPVTVG